MRSSNSTIDLTDIVARILPPGSSKEEVAKFKNKLSNAERRWRNLARIVTKKPKKGSSSFSLYLRSIMTAEMIAKNTTRGLPDVVERSDEAYYMTLLNLGSAKASNRKKECNEERRQKELQRIRNGARRWAQEQIKIESQNPITRSSTRTPLAADSIESIVAWKLASLNPRCANLQLAYPTSLTLPNLAPPFPLGDAHIDAFFGGEDNQTGNQKDPYGLLGRPPVSEAHSCLVACIFQAARDQFVASSSIHPPKISDSQSYWKQVEALQHAFDGCWMEAGHRSYSPRLFKVEQLDRTTIKWNGPSIPELTAVKEYKDRSIETLERWQRAWARMQRTRLGLQPNDQDQETDEVVGDKEG